MLVIGVAPLFAPTVGGLIAGQWGWRAAFVGLALFGAALWLAVWRRLPETLLPERRRAAGLGTALGGYRVLLSDRHFVAIAVLPGLGMAVLMSYVIGSPFVLREGYGLSANQFALVFAMNGVSLVGSAQINASLVRRVAPIRILRSALPLLLAAALVLLIVALTGAGGLFGLLASLWVTLGLLQFIPPNASDRAQQARRHGRYGGGLHRRDAGRPRGGHQPPGRRARRRRTRHVSGHDRQRDRGTADPRDRHTRLSPWGLAPARGLLNTASRSAVSRSADSRLTIGDRDPPTNSDAQMTGPA